tara:strand:+ start:248 stop:454 length:207 start_codon:yes stop_codon:yes gene_type:complete
MTHKWMKYFLYQISVPKQKTLHKKTERRRCRRNAPLGSRRVTAWNAAGRTLLIILLELHLIQNYKFTE